MSVVADDSDAVSMFDLNVNSASDFVIWIPDCQVGGSYSRTLSWLNNGSPNVGDRLVAADINFLQTF